MMECIVESPKMAHEHGQLLAECIDLTRSLSESSQRDILNVETETFASGFASRSTVGIMLSAMKIDNMVIGGPACLSDQLHHGDEILRVDGIECKTVDNLHKGLKGCDLPGTSLTITVKKVNSGLIEDVNLVRIASEAIGDRRRLFELFTSLKDRAILDHDTHASGLIDETIDLWSKMVLADLAHDRIIEENVKGMQMDCKSRVEQLAATLPKLQVIHKENSALVVLRQEIDDMTQDLEHWKEDCKVQTDIVLSLQQQLASTQSELLNTMEKNSKVQALQDRKIRDLEIMLEGSKTNVKSTQDMYRQQVSSFNAEMDELHRQLLAERRRADSLEAEKFRLTGAAEKADHEVNDHDERIQVLLQKIAELENELRTDKQILEHDKVVLKKDCELCMQDQQALELERNELKKSLGITIEELETMRKAADDLKGKDAFISAQDSSMKESNRMIPILQRELNNAQNAMEQYSTHVSDLEGKLQKLQKVDTVHQKIISELESKVLARHQAVEEKTTMVLKLEDSLKHLEQHCKEKNLEVLKFTQMSLSSEQQLKDLKNRLGMMSDDLEKSKSQSKDQVATIGLLEQQLRDMKNMLSKMSNDLKRSKSQSQEHESKFSLLEESKAKLETAVHDRAIQLQEKESLILDLQQQLKSALAEIEALRRKLQAGTADDKAVYAEVSKLRIQLSALRVERDKFASELVQLASGQAAMDTLQAQNAALKAENADLQHYHKDITDANVSSLDVVGELQEKLRGYEAQIENLRSKSAQTQKHGSVMRRAQRSAPSSAPADKSGETFLERCRELVSLVQNRVAEKHLEKNNFKIVTCSSPDTTVGISYRQDHQQSRIIVHEVLTSGPAFRSRKIAKGDEILSIDGDPNLRGGAILNALKGNNLPGSHVTLMIKKANSLIIEEVILQRMLTSDIADKRRMFDIWTDLGDFALKSRDQNIIKCAQDGFDLWAKMELEETTKNEKFDSNVAAMQHDCHTWLEALHALLSDGPDTPFVSVSSLDGEITALKQRISELEQLVANSNEASSSLGVKLGKASQTSQESQSRLEELQMEVDSMTKQCTKYHAELHALNSLNGGLELSLTQMRGQLLSATARGDQKATECDDALKRLKDLDDVVKSLKAVNGELKIRVAETEQQLRDKNLKLTALQKLPPSAAASTDNSDTLQRAIHLCQQTKEYVTSDLLAGHSTITQVDFHSNITTVGLCYDDSSSLVTGVMVGGPAFNSKRVHKGDLILAIDGHKVKGSEIVGLLKGSDKPGSIVELTLKKTWGTTEDVKLQRMSNSTVADKRKLFDLFTKILDKVKKDKHFELVKMQEEALELWSRMIMEEHDKDMKSELNVSQIQKSCNAWLEELLVLLSNGDVALWTSEGTIKKANCQQLIHTVLPSDSEDIDELRSQLAVALETVSIKDSENAGKDAEINELKMRLQEKAQRLNDRSPEHNRTMAHEFHALTSTLSSLQTELSCATSALEKDEKQAKVDQMDMADLKQKVSELDREVLAKKGNIAELSKQIADLDKGKALSHNEIARLQDCCRACRKLVMLTRRRIEEHLLPEHEILTHLDKEPTTVGISFEESNGIMTILNLMVGGPAFNSKKIHKGDQVLAIDGVFNLKGEHISAALKGSNVAGTKLTLTIKNRLTGQQEDVALTRVLTASIADKRKLFDIFTQMADRANKDKDLEAQRLVEAGLQLWSSMGVEEQRRESKLKSNVCNMQGDCEAWLRECYTILGGTDSVKQMNIDEFNDDLLFEVLEKSEEAMANDKRVVSLSNAITNA